MGRLAGYIIKNRKEYRLTLYLVIVLNLFLTFVTLLIPFILGRAIDTIKGINDVDFDQLFKYLLILISLAVTAIIVNWLAQFCVTELIQRHTYNLRVKLFNKIGRLPLKYIDSTSKGDLVTRFSIDIENIGEGMAQLLIVAIPGTFLIAMTIGFLLYTNWIIGLIIIVLTPVAFLSVNYIASRNRRYFQAVASLTGKMNGYAGEMFSALKTLTLYDYRQVAIDRYQELNSQLQVSGVDSQFYSSMGGPCSRLVNYIIYTTVGVVSSLLFLAGVGALSVGRITSLLIYCKRYSSPFNDIAAIITIINSSQVGIERVEEQLGHQEAPSYGTREIDQFTSSIVFRDVAFSYGQELLFSDLNIEIGRGQKVAIVGPTGAGKSTLINLLLRFYPVDRGDILIDGVSIYQYSAESLSRLYGLVLQESYLFKGTIRENIAFARKQATWEEIKEAAQLSKADHFIKQLPQGYDTIIDEDGGNLSEGQKQLISITRIMLLDPQILILDEATSNIDSRTERLVQKAYGRMMEGKTTFIVAHRLQTIVESDLILVMKEGRVVEQGRHQQLLALKGHYYRFYVSQFEN